MLDDILTTSLCQGFKAGNRELITQVKSPNGGIIRNEAMGTCVVNEKRISTRKGMAKEENEEAKGDIRRGVRSVNGSQGFRECKDVFETSTGWPDG